MSKKIGVNEKFDQSEYYNKEIEPLLKEAADLMEKKGISFLVAASPAVTSENIMLSVEAFYNYSHDGLMRRAIDALDPKNISNFSEIN